MPDFFRVRLAVVARSAGHSAVKRSAYQACGLAIDHLGRHFDYSRKAAERAIPTVILAPDGAPPWCGDAASLWNHAGASEKRVDAQEARIIDLSMPRAVPRDLWADAVRYVYEPFRTLGMALQIDIHDTPASDGGRNVNVHALATLRRVDRHGFFRTKERAWNDLFREREGRAVRDLIAERLTAFCREHGIDYRGDARSNAVRGLPAPEPKLSGWNAHATKRMGMPTPAVADLHRHRRRRRGWQAAVAKLAEAKAERAALEHAARTPLASRTKATDGATHTLSPSAKTTPAANQIRSTNRFSWDIDGSQEAYLRLLAERRKHLLPSGAAARDDLPKPAPAYRPRFH